MPGFLEEIAGTTLPAGYLNSYLMRQAVIQCTSGSRPPGPHEGMTIYETDTDRLLVFTTSATQWQPPWNLPWGVVAVSPAGINVALSTGETTVLAVSGVQLVANRRYRVHSVVGVNANATGYHIVRLRRDGTEIAISTFRHAAGVIDYTSVPISAFQTGVAAGSYAFTLTVQLAAGSGTTDGGSTTNHLIIEDVGPAAAPA